MKRKVYLCLLAVSALFFGCEKETHPTKPELPDIEEGTIPVVFHILYENSGDPIQSPSASLFRLRIDQLNRFYAATLFPDAKSQAVDVKFVMATHDPTGKELEIPGVHRYPYPGAAGMSADRFLDVDRTLTTRDREILWDPNRYVNVWLFSFHQDEADVTGVSYLPYCTSANPLTMLVTWNGAITEAPYYMHGIALNNLYFQSDEGIFTLCHEMGHYLGLKHAFSESTAGQAACSNPDDNASDDGCSDTPKYDRATYERAFYDNYLNGTPMPYGGTTYERQACNGQIFTSTNVMDYFQSHRTNLTRQQKARIEHVLTYSPWIPRSKTATKALLENFTSEITDVRPRPILMH